MTKIANNYNAKLRAGITSTFYFEGECTHEQYGAFQGTMVNEVSVREERNSRENGHWWSHHFPTYKLEGWSKEDLWGNVKIASVQNRPSSRILVVDAEGNETIVDYKREDI